MKRAAILAILKICGEALLLSTLAGIVIVVIGYRNQWETALEYSNAFFIAGGLAIIAGGMSRLAAGQEWRNFQLLHAESFRDMSAGERANFIIRASSSVRFVAVGLLSGVLLFLAAVLATKF